MIQINIPGKGILSIKNIVFDFNGTIASDGVISEEVRQAIISLANLGLNIFVLTADTCGTARNQCAQLPVKIEIFDNENVTEEKRKIVERLGANNTIAIGNGMNDAEMLKISMISVAVIGREGCCTKALLAADIAVNNILDAIELIINPNRMKATLRM